MKKECPFLWQCHVGPCTDKKVKSFHPLYPLCMNCCRLFMYLKSFFLAMRICHDVTFSHNQFRNPRSSCRLYYTAELPVSHYKMEYLINFFLLSRVLNLLRKQGQLHLKLDIFSSYFHNSTRHNFIFVQNIFFISFSVSLTKIFIV